MFSQIYFLDKGGEEHPVSGICYQVTAEKPRQVVQGSTSSNEIKKPGVEVASLGRKEDSY